MFFSRISFFISSERHFEVWGENSRNWNLHMEIRVDSGAAKYPGLRPKISRDLKDPDDPTMELRFMCFHERFQRFSLYD